MFHVPGRPRGNEVVVCGLLRYRRLERYGGVMSCYHLS